MYFYFDHDNSSHLETIAAFVATFVNDGELDIAHYLLYQACEKSYENGYDSGQNNSQCYEDHCYGDCTKN